MSGKHEAAGSGRGRWLIIAAALAGVFLVLSAGWYLTVGRSSSTSSVPPQTASGGGGDGGSQAPAVSPASPGAAKEPPRSFTIAATGDILIHSQLWQKAAVYAGAGERFDFRPMFAKIKPIISRADLGICHIETPLDADDKNLSSYPAFSVPHEVAEAVAWAGYDECSTASNHSLDQGSAGVKATLSALDKAGVDHAGTARTKKEANRITMLDVNGVQVAHLSYTYGFNGFTPDVPWRANRIKVADMIAEARRAKQEGAEFIILSLHWGLEYLQQPTSYQRKIATKVLGSPVVDLILGHHAHVVQPIDRIGEEFVVYGMGNSVSGQTASLGEGPIVQDGVIVQVSVTEEGKDFVVNEVTFVPTMVEAGSWRILPATGEMSGALQQSFRRTSRTIMSMHAKGVHPDR